VPVKFGSLFVAASKYQYSFGESAGRGRTLFCPYRSLSMKKIKIIPIKILKAHERVSRKNLEKIKLQIRHDGCIKDSIILDRDNFIILDGHHRTKALNDLGYKKIPAVLVDYHDKKVRVVSRRKNIMITKESIITTALSKKLYPCKTSKHFIPGRPRAINIKLEKLI